MDEKMLKCLLFCNDIKTGIILLAYIAGRYVSCEDNIC